MVFPLCKMSFPHETVENVKSKLPIVIKVHIITAILNFSMLKTLYFVFLKK